jgi:hypothetical protein
MRGHRIGRGFVLLVVAGIAVAPMAACSDDSPKAGEARLEVDGTALVVRQDGTREKFTEPTSLHAGDQVTLTDGTGALHLKGGALLELRAGTGGDEDSSVVVGPVPVLHAGDVLVTSEGHQRLSADETVLDVSLGAARVSRTVGVVVAAYDAAVHVDSAGEERDVKALRQLTVPALGHPRDQAVPLDYDARDAWDRRFLGEAIELGQRLESIALGYTQNLTDGQGRTVAFYRTVLPGLGDEAEFTPDLLTGSRPAGETLVGAAIADLGRRGTFTERWKSVFAFRDEGAAWGLVALDQGVDRSPLLGAVTNAVDESPLAIGPTPPRRPGSPSSTSTTPTTAPPTSGTTPTTRPPSSPTTTLPPPGDPGGDGLLSPILDPITDLLSGLIGGLLGGLFAKA